MKDMITNYTGEIERRGGAFSAFLLAKASCDGSSYQAARRLEEANGENSTLSLIARGDLELREMSDFDRNELISKAAVSAGTGLTGNWTEPLAEYFAAIGEFYDVARYFEIPGAMESISRVSFNQRLVGLSSGANAAWVKSGAPAPITAGALTSDKLKPLKVVSTLVVSKETLNFGDPVALRTFRTLLITAAANAINVAFVDQDNAGVSEEKPASVTNGVTASTATIDARADIKGELETHPNAQTSYVVGHPALLAGMASSQFPNVGARGGEVAGLPAIASAAVPLGDLAIIDASGVALARGDIDVSVSGQGTAIMDDDPSGAGAQVSLWQADLVGIQVSQFINWTKVRSDSVSLIEGASYGD